MVNPSDSAPDKPGHGRDLITQLAEACDDLKKKFVQELFSPAKELVISRYIQYHQAGIISMSDQLSAVMPAHDVAITSTARRFSLQAVEYLESLLRFLETRFYKFFDIEHFLSADRHEKEKNRISGLLTTVVAMLSQIQIDQHLIAAINLAIISRLNKARYEGLNYRQVNYIAGILQLIEERGRTEKLDTDVVSELLYQHNFNSPFFEEYYQQKLSDKISRAPENERKLLIDEERLKLASRMPDKLGKLINELPAIDETLLASPVFESGGQLRQHDNSNLKIKELIRMPLNFSVTQFALFIRLCYLEGCFHVHHVSDILRFFTFHFETKKQLHISIKSFGHAFYSADQANAAIIRDFLKRMINQLEKIYFPKT